MPNITQTRIEELEEISARAFELVESAVSQISQENARSAADSYADLDDMIAETNGLTHPLDAPINTSNPLHTYQLQRAVGGPLADSLLKRQGIPVERKFGFAEFLSGIGNQDNTYEGIRKFISGELKASKWSEVLNALIIVRERYQKPVIATTPASS